MIFAKSFKRQIKYVYIFFSSFLSFFSLYFFFSTFFNVFQRFSTFFNVF